MQEVYFQVKSRLGVKIRVTTSYWNFIIESKHPVMNGKETLVKNTLKRPDLIKRSTKDRSVCLYYKSYRKDFAVVVCKHLNGSGYIITTYITDRIKIGEQIWKKQR